MNNELRKKITIATVIAIFVFTLGLLAYLFQKNKNISNTSDVPKNTTEAVPLTDEEIDEALSKKAEESSRNDESETIADSKTIDETLLKKSDASDVKPLSQDEIQNALNQKSK